MLPSRDCPRSLGVDLLPELFGQVLTDISSHRLGRKGHSRDTSRMSVDDFLFALVPGCEQLRGRSGANESLPWEESVKYGAGGKLDVQDERYPRIEHQGCA